MSFAVISECDDLTENKPLKIKFFADFVEFVRSVFAVFITGNNKNINLYNFSKLPIKLKISQF